MNTRPRHLTTALLLTALGCGAAPSEEVVVVIDDAPDAGGDAGADDAARPEPGADQRVVVFDGEEVSWSGWEDGQNKREVDVTVELPAAGQTYSEIALDFALRCPNGSRCDWWDRLGSFGLVERAGEEDERYVELSRFITPYRVGASWRIDLTDLRPLLTGEVTFRVFIDTWVGPGHANGDGWLVDAALEYTGGVPARPVAGVVPVLARTRVAFGDPSRPVAEQIGALEAVVPEGASSASLRAFITGHGQGNLDNCAEFCPQFHVFEVDGEPFQELIWRDDCDSSVPQDQLGNVTSARAGWCPGGQAHDWTMRLGRVTPGEALAIGYRTSEYENTCRPEADACEGCAFGQTECVYNGSNHTEPNYQVSALLIAYE
jgi:hypothetical protein